MSFSKSRVSRFTPAKPAVTASLKPATTINLGDTPSQVKGKKYGDLHMKRNISQSSNLSGEGEKTKIPVTRFGNKSARVDSPKNRNKSEIDNVSVKSEESAMADVSQGSSKSHSKKNSGIPVKRHTMCSPRFHTTVKPQIQATLSITDSNSAKKLNISPASLELQYQSKLTRMINLKNDIIIKQKPLIELYKILQNLRDRIKETDGKEMPLEDLKLIDCSTQQEITINGPRTDLEPDPEKLKLVKSKLESASSLFMLLCRKIVEDKLNIIDKVFNEDGEWDQDVLMAKIQDYKTEISLLEAAIEEKLKEEEAKLLELMVELQQTLPVDTKENTRIKHELEKKLEETEHRLKGAVQDLHFEKAKKAKESDKIRELEKEIDKLRDKMTEHSARLEEEKTRVLHYRERHNQLEQKVKSAKGKIREVEADKKDTECQIENLNLVIKKLEEQWRSKEIYFENRQKEMQKIVKTHEINVQQMEEERRSVDVRIDNIREEYDRKEQSFENRIEEWKLIVHEAEERLDKLIAEKEELQQHYDFLKAQTDKVEIVGHHFFKLYKNVQLAHHDLDAASANPLKTDEEIALWAELEATKTSLRDAENKLIVYGEEKARFLDTITQNHVEESDLTEMTVQLLGKEETITNLNLENRDLREALDLSQEELDTKNVMIENMEKQIKTMQDNLSGELSFNEKMSQLQCKWEEELTRSSQLEMKLVKLEHKQNSTQTMLDEREGLLKIRDSLINMIQERNGLSASQNENFRNYLKTLLDEKNIEVTKLQNIITSKNTSISELESKKAVLEMTYKDTINKRVQLHTRICEMEQELNGAKEEIGRLRVINESKSICSIEDMQVANGHSPKSSQFKFREDQQKFLEHAKKISYHETKITKTRTPVSYKSLDDFHKKSKNGSSKQNKLPNQDIDKLFIVNSLAPCYYALKTESNDNINNNDDYLSTNDDYLNTDDDYLNTNADYLNTNDTLDT